MRLPFLNSTPSKAERVVSEFKGINENIVSSDGEFKVMKNMSDRFYPAISTRAARGSVISTLTKPNGYIWKNNHFYVDGTKCYYNGTQIAGMTVADSKKKIIGMGAYILVFPDKISYNTSTGAVKALESKLTQSGTATFAPLTTGSAFTRITLSGINNYFSQYDNVKITGCTNSSYNKTTVITEVGTNYIVITGALSSQFTQASGLKFERLVPDMDYVCELNNRVWGCSNANHEIYASKLGDPFNWYNYEDISTDSYSVTVGSDGDFTGCIAHLGYAMFFKENYIHMMYGDKPSNFSLNTKHLPGVRTGCSESLQIVNEQLYYVGRDGVYAFDASVPNKISNNITSDISNAVACQQDSHYYLSCKKDNVQTLLVYDPRTQIWDTEDDTEFCFASYGEGKLYYIGSDKKLRSITGDSTDIIYWSMESGDIEESSLNEKYVSRLMFSFIMDRGSEANIYMRYDDNELWERKGTISSQHHKAYTIPIIPNRCYKYQWKIEGKGEVKLLALQRTVEGGSNKNGSIQSHFRK